MALVGIDVGTQSLKVVVVDDELAPRGAAVASYAVSRPRDGHAEQDPLEWERALSVAVPEAMARAGVSAAEVGAIGVAGQLDGCVAVDAAGAPISPCLIWMDRRATLPPLDVAAFRRTTGLVADPGHMAAKARWLLAHGVDAGARFHQPVSYLVERMTGAYVFDRGLASTSMVFDLATGDYDAALLEAFDLRREALPRIAGATDVAGNLSPAGARLSGLLAGTPVVVGTGDDFATPLGAGIAGPGSIACVVGTAEVIGAVTGELVVDDGALVETHGWVSGGYFVENPGWLSGGAVAWLRQLCAFDDDAAIDASAAAVPAGADGLSFLPALSGSMAPVWNPAMRAGFLGLSPRHGRGHLARAVLEGCAFAMRDVVDRLAALGVVTAEAPIVLVGGGAESAIWARVRADVSGRPVEVASNVDACPVGAALLASVGADIDDDLERLAGRVAGRRLRLEPDPAAREAYGDAYDRYRARFAAIEALSPRRKT